MTANVNLFKFVGGFVCGAVVSTGSCVEVLNLYQIETEGHDNEKVPEAQQEIGHFGFPVTGAETRYYANHTLSYDQAKRTPRWVAEHLSNQKLLGKADRKHCRFKPDPGVPEAFSARNEDFLGSGWSRGHMAPAGDNKQSEQSMAETFYLSNIVPQNFENNAGFWNRLEMYCRELTQRFDDVWIISGPLALPEVKEDGRKMVSYQVIGKDNVAVPTHLFKAILVQKNSTNHSQSPSSTVALAAFIVPNQPIGFDRKLTEFQVSLSELEKASGITFFTKLPRTENAVVATASKGPLQQGAGSGVSLALAPPTDLCQVDGCQLMGFQEFSLYLTGRKVASARSTLKLERFMEELKEQGIAPDDYLLRLYQQKKKELANRELPDGKTGA
ncbi:nuclease EXOG, mitochondrial [Aplochiton taeniatus]